MVQQSIRDSLYLSEDPKETTFKYDNQLPSLPVPDVKQSVEKLLDSIKPIVASDDSFKDTERRAIEFLKDPNVSELQDLLKLRASQNKNWLEDWWLEFAYLRSRKPLIPYSNMAAPLPIMEYWPIVRRGEPGFESVRARRAALSMYFQVSFWKILREEKMRPMIHKGIPWSMAQFRYLFNTVRLPGEPKDELKSWFKTLKEGPPESTEIIVLHRGYIFAIQPVTMHGPHACILSAPQIERQLRHIEEYCAQRPPGSGVGSLTTGERSDWAEAREDLAKVCDNNRKVLDRISKALSVLVLQDDEPDSNDELLRISMCGDPNNRWADKSITSIAFKNGTFGANADHTPYDGFCTGIMTHYLMTSVEECAGSWSDSMIKLSNSSWACYTEPELLEFKLSPQLRTQITEASSQFHKVCSTIDTLHRTFNHFGKALAKEHRFHPEAFVQCAIHTAYYKVHKKMAPAYVTASTRKFHNGRTETCRSCYPEMRIFAEHISDFGSKKPRDAYQLLKRSVDKFQSVMADANNGQGCDRHLLGLYLTAMLEGRKVPELFDDELVQRTNNYILSTSCGGYWNVCGGVPPLVEEGYGCFYGIEDHAITFCCTAYKTCTSTDIEAFYRSLESALIDMQKIMLTAKL